MPWYPGLYEIESDGARTPSDLDCASDDERPDELVSDEDLGQLDGALHGLSVADVSSEGALGPQLEEEIQENRWSSRTIARRALLLDRIVFLNCGKRKKLQFTRRSFYWMSGHS